MDGIKRDEIRAIMGRKSMSIASLSKSVGVTRATMSAFLHGKSPSYAMMRGIRKALCLTNEEAFYIFFESDLRNT